VAATRRVCCLIVVAHHRYLASTRAGSISIAWKASVARKLTVTSPDRQADWQSRQVGKDGSGSLRRQTLVEMRMDTTLAVPPSRPSLLIVLRLCFAACQCSTSGEEGIAFVRKYDEAPSMTALCVLHRLSLADDPWPDDAAEWCRIVTMRPECASRQQQAVWLGAANTASRLAGTQHGRVHALAWRRRTTFRLFLGA
jgi:hypothetical protein